MYAIRSYYVLNSAGPTGGRVLVPSTGEPPKSVAFIQCVGSRDKTVGNEYCSRVCCMAALKNSQMVKERYPDTDITIHYIDIRAAGEMYEEYRITSYNVCYTKLLRTGFQTIRDL